MALLDNLSSIHLEAFAEGPLCKYKNTKREQKSVASPVLPLSAYQHMATDKNRIQLLLRLESPRKIVLLFFFFCSHSACTFCWQLLWMLTAKALPRIHLSHHRTQLDSGDRNMQQGRFHSYCMCVYGTWHSWPEWEWALEPFALRDRGSGHQYVKKSS